MSPRTLEWEHPGPYEFGDVKHNPHDGGLDVWVDGEWRRADPNPDPPAPRTGWWPRYGSALIGMTAGFWGSELLDWEAPTARDWVLYPVFLAVGLAAVWACYRLLAAGRARRKGAS